MDEINELKDKRVVIWGAKKRGQVISSFLWDYCKIHVDCFVDRDEHLIGTLQDDVCILSEIEFIKQYNRKDTMVIVGGYNPENLDYISSFLKKNGFKGECVGCYDFHDKYEFPILLKRNEENNIDYDKSIDQWSDSILAEAVFWKDEVIRETGMWHSHYLTRIDSSKEFLCNRVKEYIKPNSIVLDVGCGICSNYGRFIDGKELLLTGVDPLAHFYNRMNRKAYEQGLSNNILPPHIEFGMFEFLSYFFDEDSCDVIIIDNALDHCIDPLSAIIECLKVLKVGGVLSTFHHRNEGYRNYYEDMHQWNVCSSYEGELIIWNKESFININHELKGYVSIDTKTRKSERVEMPFGGVVCNIIKEKEIPNIVSKPRKCHLGKVMELMMERLSDPAFAHEVINFWGE